jgi:hypothetical protein
VSSGDIANATVGLLFFPAIDANCAKRRNMQTPKTIVLDIETSPMVVLVWELGDQRVNANQILKDWDIMAWSYKKLGEPESSRKYYDRRHDLNDKKLLQPLWNVLNDADIIITQNGKSFDAKKINARLILMGFPPPSPYKHLDTYLISKSVAAFTSHSLDYLTNKLNTKYKKLSHPKFPGLSLWKECMSLKIVEQPWKNPSAWNEMKQYNMHDVFSTEELYTKIKDWTP